MKGIKLKWIIGLMGCAMIGLIALQLYWINSLIVANEERFRKDVLEALSNVSGKLERQETLAAVQKLNYQLSNNPSYDTSIRRQQIADRRQSEVPGKMQLVERGNQQLFVFADTVNNGGFEFTVNFSMYAGSFFPDYTADAQVPFDERDLKIQELEEKLARVSRRYELTFDVMEELTGSRRPLASRFSPQQLDSLLQKELESKGIHIAYEYGILQPNQRRFLIHTVEAEPQKLAESELRASLFPNDLIADGSQLIIQFPDKRSFLLGKVWTALVSSGVLVLVILFCFGYSIRTILRQKKLSDMKNDFINNMTHELKTPISTVSLAVEALSDREIEQSPLRERYIHVIGEENKRLGNQVEKVLQIAAIDRQDFNLKRQKLQMQDLIKDAAAHLSMQIEQRGGRINLVEKAGRDMVLGDEMHLTNIIINLLDNANKYSPEAPNITIRTESDEDDFIFSVHDHGVGMTKEQQKHIFEKFYRVPTGDLHNVKGFGLGLAYVHSMVKAHDGNIHVDSEPGKGSKFSITLPLAKNES